mgnify:CR=1 FL=1
MSNWKPQFTPHVLLYLKKESILKYDMSYIMPILICIARHVYLLPIAVSKSCINFISTSLTMYIYGCHILVDILCGSCFSIMFNQKPPCILDHKKTFIFSLFYSNRLRSELCTTSPQTTSRTSSSRRLYRSSSSDTRLPTLQTSSL